VTALPKSALAAIVAGRGRGAGRRRTRRGARTNRCRRRTALSSSLRSGRAMRRQEVALSERTDPLPGVGVEAQTPTRGRRQQLLVGSTSSASIGPPSPTNFDGSLGRWTSGRHLEVRVRHIRLPRLETAQGTPEARVRVTHPRRSALADGAVSARRATRAEERNACLTYMTGAATGRDGPARGISGRSAMSSPRPDGD